MAKFCWAGGCNAAFRRLKANGQFHELFGWNGVLRIFFFHQKWQWIGFSWKKSFETCFVYFATLPKQLTTIKCFQKKTKDWFEIFSKTANFLTFLMKKENSQNTISAKKFVKRTVCLQPSKCLIGVTYYFLNASVNCYIL